MFERSTANGKVLSDSGTGLSAWLRYLPLHVMVRKEEYDVLDQTV